MLTAHSRRLLRVTAAGFATLLLTFLALQNPAFAQTSPQQVVVIGGALTAIVYALGQQDRVVAVDTTSVFPPEALAGWRGNDRVGAGGEAERTEAQFRAVGSYASPVPLRVGERTLPTGERITVSGVPVFVLGWAE